MAKRLIDTDIFKKGFVKSLEAPYKLLWLYIINDCNHAGIWEVEFDVAAMRLGLKLNQIDAVEKFAGKIEVCDNGTKWFIPSFIEFQYGVLNPQNRAHSSVIQILTKLNLYPIKPLTSPLQGCKDMDKDKDKDMDKDKPREAKTPIPTQSEFISYGLSITKNESYKFPIAAKYNQWLADGWKDGNGRKIGNWKTKLQNTIPHMKPFTSGEQGFNQFKLP